MRMIPGAIASSALILAALLASAPAGAGALLAGSPTRPVPASPDLSAPRLVPPPVPGRSRLLPSPADVAKPEERAVLGVLAPKMVKAAEDHDSAAALAALDEALADLPEATPLRGVVQASRVPLLHDAQKIADATAAAEESIRLLPGYSGPLLAAAGLYAYTGKPHTAADYLLRASEIDPASVRKIDDYEIHNILVRLRNADDYARARKVTERLLELGWIGHAAGSRSNLARDGIISAMRQGDVARARELVGDLASPSDTRLLQSLELYRPLWPVLEAAAGDRLSTQWRAYLIDARTRWEGTRDLARGLEYLRILRSARLDAKANEEFLPVLARHVDDPDVDVQRVFMAPVLAETLLATGRGAEVLPLFDRLEHDYPLGSSAMALNVSANRAQHLLHIGRYADAVAEFDRSIADAGHWGAEVNSDALAAMRRGRFCALHELGGDRDPAKMVNLVEMHGTAIDRTSFLLCLDQPDRARAAAIEALSTPEGREAVITFMQPPSRPPADQPTAYLRKEGAREERLRHDPALLAAIKPYGRILPFALSDGAPKQAP